MNLNRIGVAMMGAVLAGAGGVAENDDLTTLPWSVTASDVAGRPWSNSTLVFTQQTAEGDGFLLEGYFDWYLDNIPQGRELVRGTMSATGGIELAGYELINPGDIILDAYQARLNAEGTGIVNGTFGVPEGIAGVWSARQTIPASIRFTPPDELQVCWSSPTNYWYQLQFTTNLALGTWEPVSAGWTQGAGEEECAVLTVLPDTDEQSYRVALSKDAPGD